jgi:phage terminase small subunit
MTLKTNKTITEIQKVSEKENGKRLTMKQAFFVQQALKTNNVKESAKVAYDIGSKHRANAPMTQKEIDKNAYIIANENLKKPTIQKTIDAILNEQGLTKEFLVMALKNDIEAKPGNRARELELAGRWSGIQDNAGTNNISINITPEQAERLFSRRSPDIVQVIPETEEYTTDTVDSQ